MFFFGLAIGLIVGAFFSPTILKWLGKGKTVAKEITADIKKDAQDASKKI